MQAVKGTRPPMTICKDFTINEGEFIGKGAQGTVKKIYSKQDKSIPWACKIIDKTNLEDT